MNIIRSGTAHIELHAGSSIEEACLQASALALQIRGTVHFRFNGVDMATDGTKTVPAMVDTWRSRIEYNAAVEKAARGGR